MEIEINNDRILSEIQKEFNTEFPYLKIEFFDTPHLRKEALPKSKMYPVSRKVAVCRKTSVSGILEIDKSDTVFKVEEEFWSHFGLSVQVFRKSGNLWIETSLTDSWTLDRQNKEGMEISNHKDIYKSAEDLDATDRDKWA